MHVAPVRVVSPEQFVKMTGRKLALQRRAGGGSGLQAPVIPAEFQLLI